VNMNRRKQIADILNSLGFPSNLRGYYYLLDAVELCMNDRSLIFSMTNGLYPEVARLHSSTASRVERGMRHAIETAFLYGSTEAQERYFGSSINFNKGKPTNRHFISAIVNDLTFQEAGAAGREA